MSSENKSLLTKGIGGIGAALLVLNGLIGAGIFALPAKMAAELGALSAVSTESSFELSGHSDLDEDGLRIQCRRSLAVQKKTAFRHSKCSRFR